MPLECTVRCKGTGTLELLTAVPGVKKVLAHFKFNLAAHATANVTVKLSKAATKLFAHHPPAIIGVAVSLKGPSVHGTYAATVTIAKKKAPTQHSRRL